MFIIFYFLIQQHYSYFSFLIQNQFCILFYIYKSKKNKMYDTTIIFLFNFFLIQYFIDASNIFYFLFYDTTAMFYFTLFLIP